MISVPAHAGPLFPCIGATLSAKGSALVVDQLSFDHPDETSGQIPRTSTFTVLRRYVDANDGLRLNGPDVYWVGPSWSIVFHRSDRIPICPYVLVTDDGEFLILVDSGFGPSAMSIYRHHRNHGVLVRELRLEDIWPRERIPVSTNDESPRWFAGGSFAFSPDNHALLYKTAWGTTLKISLDTGAVSGK
jgi:hypothetical protein